MTNFSDQKNILFKFKFENNIKLEVKNGKKYFF